MNSNAKSYAHSKEGHSPEAGWQLLEEHARGVAQRATEFAKLFESAAWVRDAAWLHDFGKCDPAFQAYLLRENGLDDTGYDETGKGRINHSSAGAAPLAGDVNQDSKSKIFTRLGRQQTDSTWGISGLTWKDKYTACNFIKRQATDFEEAYITTLYCKIVVVYAALKCGSIPFGFNAEEGIMQWHHIIRFN